MYFWWFDPPLWLLGAYVAVCIVATLSVPLFYRLFGYTNVDETQWLQAFNLQEHEQLMTRLKEVRQSLQTLSIKEGVRQADTLMSLLDDYRSVVETRFMGKKFSPMTYLNAARTVQRHVINNLTDVVAMGHSLSTISRNQGNPQSNGQAELYQEQEQRMNNLLQENNKLFSALTDTAVEVANISSINDFERLDTLARLVSLAETARKTGS